MACLYITLYTSFAILILATNVKASKDATSGAGRDFVAHRMVANKVFEAAEIERRKLEEYIKIYQARREKERLEREHSANLKPDVPSTHTLKQTEGSDLTKP